MNTPKFNIDCQHLTPNAEQLAAIDNLYELAQNNLEFIMKASTAAKTVSDVGSFLQKFQPEMIKFAVANNAKQSFFPVYPVVCRALWTFFEKQTDEMIREFDEPIENELSPTIPTESPTPILKAVTTPLSGTQADGWEVDTTHPANAPIAPPPERATGLSPAFAAPYGQAKKKLNRERPVRTVAVLRGFQDLLDLDLPTRGKPDLRTALNYMKKEIAFRNKKGA